MLDAFVGDEQQRRRREARLAWRELAAARRRHDELTRDSAAAEARLSELRALAEDTVGFEPETADELRAEPLDARIILGSILFSVAVSLMSGLYPAWMAARMTPVEAISYE